MRGGNELYCLCSDSIKQNLIKHKKLAFRDILLQWATDDLYQNNYSKVNQNNIDITVHVL